MRVEHQPDRGKSHLPLASWLPAIMLFAVSCVSMSAMAAAPANDNLANAVVLTNSLVSGNGSTTPGTFGTNVSATKETGEVPPLANAGGASVWYKWTPVISGTATVAISGSTFQNLLGVYTSSANPPAFAPANTLTLVTGAAANVTNATVSFAATAGTIYYISVDGNFNGTTTATGTFTVTATVLTNDLFANAATVVGAGSSANVSGTNVGAKLETGEVPPLKNLGGSSVWYKWTAPVAGTALIQETAINFKVLLGVYTGSAVNALTVVQAQDAFGSAVTFPTAAGATYFVSVDGDNTGTGAATGTFTLNFDVFTTPPNDNFAAPTVLTGNPALSTGYNFGATKETNEPTILANVGGSSVWYSYTAPVAGSMTVNLTNSFGFSNGTSFGSFNGLLAVYTGTALNALTIANKGSAVASGTSLSVTFPTAAGVAYVITVDGNNPGFGLATTGTFNVNATVIPAPANDNIANAIALTGAPAQARGTIAGASAETGELTVNGTAANASVWYTYTAPVAGTCQIAISNSALGSNRLGVYTNTATPLAVGTLTTAKNVNGGVVSRSGTNPGVSFTTAAGVNYFISVDGSPALTGAFTITANTLATPANDAIGAAVTITGAPATVVGTNVGASVEKGEAFNGGSTVWYTWTAPTAGTANVSIIQSSYSNSLQVFKSSATPPTFSPTNTLTFIASAFGTGAANFTTAANATYFIQVDGQNFSGIPSAGNFTLKVNVITPPGNDNFANAIDLGNTVFATVGNNNGATSETNAAAVPPVTEPFSSNFGQHTIWYKWTTATAGNVTLNTFGTDPGVFPSIDVYVSNAVSPAPTTVSTLTKVKGTSSSSLTFAATAGTVYFFQLDSSTTGNISFNLPGVLPPPANDNLAKAAVLTGAPATATGTNVGATSETNEALFQTSGSTGGVSVWYTWAAPAAGTATVTLSNSAVTNVLSVFTSSATPAGFNTLSIVGNVVTGNNAFVSFPTAANVTYFISVDGSSSSDVGTFTITTALLVPPGNDNFANAALLSGTPAQALGSNVFATKEAGEPATVLENHGGSSVWYKWVSPVAGTASVKIINSAFQNLVAVYTGSAVNALTLVNNATVNAGRTSFGTAAANSANPTITFATAANVTYFISVDGNNSTGTIGNAATGDFNIGVDVLAAPTNDNIASATDLLSAATFAVVGNNIGATQEQGELIPSGGKGRTIWFKWTAPTTRNVVLNTIGSDPGITPKINVYSGTATSTVISAIPIGVSVNGSFNLYSFNAVAGTLYYFQMDDNGTPGAMALNLPAAPANDAFASAIDLGTVATFNVLGTTLGATNETNFSAVPPVTEPGSGLCTVWYKWTAPAAGKVRINTIGSDSSPTLTVYTGTALANLVFVNSGNASVQVNTTASAVYFFQVSGNADKFALNLVANPANDDFANAQDLGNVAKFDVFGSNAGATNETNLLVAPAVREPIPGTGATIWYKWTSPVTKPVTVQSKGRAGYALGVFTGASVGALTTPFGTVGTGTSTLKFNAVTGTAYFFSLDGTNGADLGLTEIALNTTVNVPANDNFASATPLLSTDSVPGDNTNATAEAGEPAHGDIAASNSVWYTWTAPGNGRAVLSLTNEGANHSLAAYVGTAVGALTLVDQATSGAGNTLNFSVASGTVCKFAVDGGPGAFTINIVLTPANDNFANSIAVTGATFTVIGTGTNATVEPFEPGSQTSTVWYNWTAPAAGEIVLVATSGANISVFMGASVDALTAVLPIKNNGSGSEFAFNAVANTKYQIQVGVSSDFQLSGLTPPANDNFANAQVVTGATWDVIGTTNGATTEPGESTFQNSVWYKWVPPANEHVSLEFVTGSSVSANFYLGTAVNALSRIPLDPTDDTRFGFNVTGGTTYFVAVGGSPGLFELVLHVAPSNDNFASSIALTGNPASAIGNNFDTTHEAGEPDHNFSAGENSGVADQHSVWYNWTAPGAGKVQVLVNGSASFDVAIYTGTAVNALTRVASGNGNTTFTAVSGTVYQIAVDSNQSSGRFSLAIELAPPNDNFVNAIVLKGNLPIITTGSNLLATKEPGEPQNLNSSSQASVWWSYTPTVSHRLEISTKGSTFDTLLAVYTGTVVSNLTLVANNDNRDQLDTTSVLQFDAVAGTTYSIVVDGTSSNDGKIVLSVSDANIAKTSPLTATPVPAVETEAVTFVIGTDATEFFHWDFGDGSTQDTIIPTTTHVFAVAGTYPVTVTASVLNGTSVSDTLSLVVDSKIDLGGVKATVTLNFGAKKPGTDAVSFSGTIALLGTTTSGPIVFNLGPNKEFTITDTLVSGTFKSKTDAIKLTAPKIAGTNTGKIQLAFKGDYIKTFAALGLTPTAVTNKRFVVPAQIIFNGTSYEFVLNLAYTATSKKGTLK